MYLDSLNIADVIIVDNIPANAEVIETACGHNANCIFSRLAASLAAKTDGWCETGAGAVFGASAEELDSA